MKLKHSKYKNIGLMFEILVKKVTAEILASNNASVAHKILEQHFNKNNAELHQEFLLTKSLVETTYKEDRKAEMLIENTMSSHSKINKQKLNKQKYNLVKAIKESYDLEEFFGMKVDNYPVLASISKMFEYNGTDVSPKEWTDNKFSILEHTTNSQKGAKKIKSLEKDELKEIFEQQDRDIQILSQKLLIEKFNARYSNGLNEAQRNIMKNYITSNNDGIRKNIASAILYIESLVKNCKDDIFKIKLNEVHTLLTSAEKNKQIDDKKIIALLQIYEINK